MKIAIAVHGRFHCFDLARELLKRGHGVTLLTNYPRFVVKRYGVPVSCVWSLVSHGMGVRIADRLTRAGLISIPDAFLHNTFGRWAGARLVREPWDAVACMSGVGEEPFRKLGGKTRRWCMRMSTHIRVQDRLLKEEGVRTGLAVERPSPWIIAREEREYELAERVIVPASFARQTFVEQGCDPAKLVVVPLGVNTRAFRPRPDVIEERCRRILAGEPLRVAYFGTICLRKGVWDLISIARALHKENFRFDCTGVIAHDARSLVGELRRYATLHPSLPGSKLPAMYDAADVYLFPTIEDGYPMLLDQARAAAVPILCSANCSGPDVIAEGRTGWVLPARVPEAYIERLHWCESHRSTLADMIRTSYTQYRPRDWSDMAADFEKI